MRVGMIGVGKLGLPLCLAMEQRGHTVLGYDTNPAVAGYVAKRAIPYEEEGAPEALKDTKLELASLERVLTESELVFVAVQTPHHPQFEGTLPITDARSDFDYSSLRGCLQAVSSTLESLAIDRTVVVISTVLPGTMRRYIMPGLSSRMRLCYSPSFIAMGTAMRDFLHPELVLFGQDHPEALAQAQLFFKTITDAPVFATSIENAELIKVTYNTWISLKIAFGNTLMEICHKTPGTNVDAVVDALSLAKRRLISPAYLRGGMGDGGGCLPPDGLVYCADGVRRIEEIESGDLVLGGDGRLHEVLDTYRRPFKGQVVNVKSRGNLTITLTPEHPVKVAKDLRKRYETGGIEKRVTTYGIQVGAVEEIRADQLSDDYYMLFPVPRDESFADDTKATVAALGGYYLGDGCVWKDRQRGTTRRIEFCLNQTTKADLVERIVSLVNKLSPASPPAKVVADPDSQNLAVRFNSADVATAMDAEFGHGAEYKAVPRWALYGDVKHAVAMLYGMIRTDGSSHEEGISFSTTSVQLAHAFSLMLRRLEIPSTFAEQKPRTTRDGVHHKRAFQVEVANAFYLEKLADLLQLDLKHKMQEKRYEGTCFIRDGFFFHKIQRVSFAEYEGTVHNINVADVHDYVTPGGVVQNCHPRDGIAMSWLARELDLSHDIFHDAMKAREDQTAWLADLVVEHHRAFGLPIVLLGAAFKANVNLVTGSPALLLAYKLRERGYNPHIVDPVVAKNPEYGASWHGEMPNYPAIYFISTAHDCWHGITVPRGSVVLDPHRKFAAMAPDAYVPIGG